MKPKWRNSPAIWSLTFAGLVQQALNGKPLLGRVTFRDTKTGGDRTISLHPEAEAELRAILEPHPSGPVCDIATRREMSLEEAVEAWGRLPVFRKRGSKEPMDRHSYKKAWEAALQAAQAEHRELSGMVVRDLRKTARTTMTNARVPEPTIRRILGHSVDVSQGYYDLTDEAADLAILSLSLEKPYTEPYTRPSEARNAKTS